MRELQHAVRTQSRVQRRQLRADLHSQLQRENLRQRRLQRIVRDLLGLGDDVLGKLVRLRRRLSDALRRQLLLELAVL